MRELEQVVDLVDQLRVVLLQHPDGGGPRQRSGQTVATSADPGGGLSFTQTNLKAKSGSVTLVMTNPSSSGTSHGIGIQGNGVGKNGQVVSPGAKSTVTVTLKPGKYEFYCPIPAHKAAGMTGTLIVS